MPTSSASSSTQQAPAQKVSMAALAQQKMQASIWSTNIPSGAGQAANGGGGNDLLF